MAATTSPRPHVVVIANPMATGVTPPVARAIRSRLERVATVELRRTERPGHAVELARAAAAAGVQAVVVMGGDGTMNEVVNGVGNDAAIGVLPLGGTSVLARALGMPRDPLAAADQIADALAEERTRWLRLGTLNGRRFAFAAGVGLDAELVRRIDDRGRADGRRPGDAIFAIELARLLARADYARPRVTIDVGGHEERASFVLVANVHPWSFLGPVPLRAAPRAIPEAGVELVAPRRLRRRDVPGLLARVLLNPRHAHGDDDAVLYLHDLRSAVVRSDRPLPAQVDGDDVGDVTEAVIGVDDAGARFLV